MTGSIQGVGSNSSIQTDNSIQSNSKIHISFKVRSSCASLLDKLRGGGKSLGTKQANVKSRTVTEGNQNQIQNHRKQLGAKEWAKKVVDIIEKKGTIPGEILSQIDKFSQHKKLFSKEIKHLMNAIGENKSENLPRNFMTIKLIPGLLKEISDGKANIITEPLIKELIKHPEIKFSEAEKSLLKTVCDNQNSTEANILKYKLAPTSFSTNNLQKDLVTTYIEKGIEGWTNAVVDNLKQNPENFDQIFSKENGIFDLSKLSSKDLTTIISKLSSEEDALSFCKSLPDIKAKEIFNKNANDINQNDVVRMRLRKQAHSLLANLKPLSESYRGKTQIPRKKFEMSGENKDSKDELDKMLDELDEMPVAKKIINPMPKQTPPPTEPLSDNEIDELLKDLTS